MQQQFRRPQPLPNINNVLSEMRWSAVPAGAKLTYISALIRRFMRHHLLLHARASSKYILSYFSYHVNIFILISIFYRKIFPIIYSKRRLHAAFSNQLKSQHTLKENQIASVLFFLTEYDKNAISKSELP